MSEEDSEHNDSLYGDDEPHYLYYRHNNLYIRTASALPIEIMNEETKQWLSMPLCKDSNESTDVFLNIGSSSITMNPYIDTLTIITTSTQSTEEDTTISITIPTTVEETTTTTVKQEELIFNDTNFKIQSVAKSVSVTIGAFLMVMILFFIGAYPISVIEGNYEKETTGHIEKWTYPNSIYFSITTISTIGYGDLYPVTTLGKLYVLLFCFMAMGVIGCLFSLIGSSVIHSVESVVLLVIVKIRLFIIYSVHKLNPKISPEQRLRDKKFLKFLESRYGHIIIEIFMIVIYELIGAIIFSNIEGWTYFDSIYYSFVTLATYV
jgi:hypothetical protein